MVSMSTMIILHQDDIDVTDEENLIMIWLGR